MALIRDTLTGWPVTLADIRAHVNVDHTDDDALLERAIAAACEGLEREYNLAIGESVWSLYLDEFPDEDCMEFPVRPITAVTGFSWTDFAGTTRTWTVSGTDLQSGATTKAHVNVIEHVPEIELAYGQYWPMETLKTSNPIRVTFSAGWTVSTVPGNVRAAILLLAASLYENREAVIIGNTASAVSSELVRGVAWLMASERLWT